MKFLRALFGKKTNNDPFSRANADSLEQSYRDTIGSIVDEDTGLRGGQSATDGDVSDVLTNVNSKLKKADEAPVNIWDLDEGGSTELPSTAPKLPQAAPAAAATAASRSPARSRRTKTRLIGFDKSDGDVVDIFNDAPKVADPAPTPVRQSKFPVGWIVVSAGPGRGESYPLYAGMSQIGRGDDQQVKLDFGDNSISRANHAAIVYDPETAEFTLGHGGKSNIVRLNDKPLISNETLNSSDIVRIGETTLRFTALCGEDFRWDDDSEDGEDDEDVAIA